MAKTYNSDEVTVILAGIPIMGGYADGEFLRIEEEADAFLDVVGTDGEVTRSKSRDGRATVTLILMQSADANDTLSALHTLDKNTPGGAGIGEMLVRDRGGRALYRGQCWIAKAPSVSFGREAGPREWKLRVPKLIRVDGGNLSV